jgi:uncharacterized Zn finger protein
MGWYGFRPYVPVAQRRAKATAYAAKLAKKEKRTLAPVQLSGRKIAQSFWGLAWCENLERYSDFANRLPRGRTYVRNGSVIDLQIKTGRIEAIVSGSEVYRVKIDIKTLPPALWKHIKQDCAQSIASLIDLLQGRFSEGVMGRLTQPKDGLFPKPAEIDIKCSCPDWAYLCKHAAAVLYGVGARLDTAPEMLFTLRNVDHLELVTQAVAAESLDQTLSAGSPGLANADLGEVFGIDLDTGQSALPAANAAAATDAGSSPAVVISAATKKGIKPPLGTAQRRKPKPKAAAVRPRGSAKRKVRKTMALSS